MVILILICIVIFLIFEKGKLANTLSENEEKNTSLNEKYSSLNKKYSSLFDKTNPWLEEYKTYRKFKSSIEEQIIIFKLEKNSTKKLLDNLKNDKFLLESYISDIQINFNELDKQELIQISGSYEGNEYDFDNSNGYSEELKKIRTQEKELIRSERAVTIEEKKIRKIGIVENDKFMKDFTKLILRAFNGECDGLFSKIRYSGELEKYQDKIKKVFDIIEKLGTVLDCRITIRYLNYKLQEAELIYKYLNKKQEEIEEQRAIREQMREEEKARKEHEKAIKDAEHEEARKIKALESAKKEYFDLMNSKSQEEREKYSERIAELEKQLELAKENKERAVSQAQLTRSGHVYVISNIGSFGENVYKIGMTRRLEPLDRVKELGDASVPFPFDVHAMIYSLDAPKLENALHKKFSDKRLNLVNIRREFFNITLDDIEEEVRKDFGEFKLTKIAKAEQYRKSLEIKKQAIK